MHSRKAIHPSQGNFARHLNTLAALISGIVGSKSTQLPHIATKSRWHQAREPRQTLCAVVRQRPYPGGGVLSAYAEVLLRHLALQTLVLVMDGSSVAVGVPH